MNSKEMDSTMKNENALAFFAHRAKNDPTKLATKFNEKNDHSDLDAEFIRQYVMQDTAVCDFGSGSGLIINRLCHSVKKIVAVEPFKELTDKIHAKDNVFIVNSTIDSFETDELFNMVTCFGVVSYFNADEIISVYKKCYRLLHPKGMLIVKSQFGAKEDVVVSGFSQEIGTNYYSEYRHLTKEKSILLSVGFVDLHVFDIYPPEYNRWNNTHFYAITAKRP